MIGVDLNQLYKSAGGDFVHPPADRNSLPKFTQAPPTPAPTPVNTPTDPSHYKSHPSGVEPITINRHESFLRGNALKYILRAPYKQNELQDIEKALVYLNWERDRLVAEKEAGK